MRFQRYLSPKNRCELDSFARDMEKSENGAPRAKSNHVTAMWFIRWTVVSIFPHRTLIYEGGVVVCGKTEGLYIPWLLYIHFLLTKRSKGAKWS